MLSDGQKSEKLKSSHNVGANVNCKLVQPPWKKKNVSRNSFLHS